MNTDLAAAYRATNYQLTIGGQQVAARVGEPSPSLGAQLVSQGWRRWAFITAWNPQSQRLTSAENARRNAQLFQRIASKDYAPAIAIPDDADWPREPGFVLFDEALSTLLALAQSFGQNAVVVGEGGDAPELVWVGASPSQ